jgi:hypothetical protein
MRCKCCDKKLSEVESVKKDHETKEYLDTCSYCLAMSNPFNIDNYEEEDNEIKTYKKK